MTRDRPSTAGRPRGFDTDEALDAALRLFWHNGFRATTTRELEAGLGLSQSSLYNAFGSKQDLLEAALSRYEDRIEHELLGPLENADDGLAAVDRFFANLGYWITHHGRRGCMLVNIMSEDGGASKELTTRTRGYRNRLRRALRGAIGREPSRDDKAKAGNANDEIAARADLLISVMLGVNVAARGGASLAELRRLIAAARKQIASWRGGPL